MDLCTLEDYKTYKKIEHNKDDSQLGALIPAVSALVKTYTANAIVDYAIEDKVEIFDIKRLLLNTGKEKLKHINTHTSSVGLV